MDERIGGTVERGGQSLPGMATWTISQVYKIVRCRAYGLTGLHQRASRERRLGRVERQLLFPAPGEIRVTGETRLDWQFGVRKKEMGEMG